MAIAGVDPKCYILALFVRDDGARFLLGDDPYEFKDKQLHFQPNTMANDVVEVQGNDGYLLAGQVRRPGTQSFDGYVGNGTNSKPEVEAKRRDFLQFFRRSHFYKVIYVFPNGTAIQRKQGFLVDDPTVQELYQQYPEYHVALNFEDVNYYTYEEDDQGHEIYAEEAIIRLVGGGATGGLIWDNNGVVWENPRGESTTVSGTDFQIDNLLPTRVPISEVELQGDTYQQTYSGKNLFPLSVITSSTNSGVTFTNNGDSISIQGTASANIDKLGYVNLDTVPASLIENGATYTISTNKPLPSGVILSVLGYKETNNWTTDLVVLNGDGTRLSSSKTVSMPATTARIRYNLKINSGTTVDISNLTIQYEKGSSVTSFEPYVGGVPSPNPDYPQVVQVVTGEQTVEVTGKNLFDYEKACDSFVGPNGTSAVTSGASFSNGIGTVSRSNYAYGGTYMNGFKANLVEGQTYTVSADFKLTGTGDNNIRMTFFGGTAEYVTVSQKDEWIRLSRTFTPNAAVASDGRLTICPWGNNNSVDFKNVQLELGSTATAYEPYQSQSYEINLGKNLFDKDNVNQYAGYFDGSAESPTLVSGATIRNRVIYIKCKPNTAYSVSLSTKSGINSPQVGTTDSLPVDNLAVARLGNFRSESLKLENLTTSASAQYLVIRFQTSSASAQLDNILQSILSGLQIEEGPFATPYSAYFTPIELCKISDYQDYIYKGDDGWYLHKEVEKVVLDSTMSWEKSASITTVNRYRSLTVPARAFSSSGVYCASSHNIGINASRSDAGQLGVSSRWAIDGGLFFATPLGLADTLADFNTWVDANKPIVYYAITTPPDTKITDADLVAQLDALGATRLFIGENNVLVTSAGSNLPATLQFDYYTKYTALGAEWEEGGTKGATIIDVNAIDNTYPVWELTGPAINPTLSVLTTNTTLTYNGTITASQKLVIDMFNKTATLNGTSVIGNISGDFVYMAPGTNRVAYTAGNTDAPDSTIYWQEVVG